MVRDARRTKVGSLVRRIYEARPYPSTDTRELDRRQDWALAPLPWINALSRPGREKLNYQKILIAGCGTGLEAFRMQRLQPGAKIVAVDFSPRSIAIARKFQRDITELQNIRFKVADLSDSGLSKRFGHDFDFVSCHGVLSYIPNP